MTSLRGHDRSEFSRKVRADAFRRCCDDKGIPHCEGCGVEITAATGCFFEHMDPDGLGGEPTLENCQVRCKTCKKAKDKIDNGPHGESRPRAEQDLWHSRATAEDRFARFPASATATFRLQTTRAPRMSTALNTWRKLSRIGWYFLAFNVVGGVSFWAWVVTRN